MPTNRLILLFMVVTLIIVTALTVREALATAAVVSQSSTSRRTSVECASLPSRYSIRVEYLEEADMSFIRTENGPTGVDGGLVELLSSYRTCSQ